MPRHYALKTFLRTADNGLLRHYLIGKDIAHDVDWDSLSKAEIDPVFEAIVSSPDKVQAELDRDFRGIWELVPREAGIEFLIAFLERIGDILEEDQAEDDVFVLGRVHMAAQLARCGPECLLEAKLGSGVDVLGGAQPFLQRKARFVEKRDQHAIHDEPRGIFSYYCCLPHRLAKGLAQFDRLITGGDGSDYLQ